MKCIGRARQGLFAAWSLLACLATANGATLKNGAANTLPRTNPPVAARPGPVPPRVGSATNAAGVLRAERQRPVDIADPWRWAWLGGIVVASVGTGAAVAAWWRRRPEAVVASPPAPDVAVVARARILAARQGMGDARAYVGAVSDAVRAYLEGRFGLRATGQTTEEFLGSLGGKALPGMEGADWLGAFLEQCDLIKFAGWRPGDEALEQLEAASLELVDRTTLAARANGSGGAA